MSGVTLGDALRERNNALNAIRLVCASLVVFSHAFPLGGRHEPVVLGQTLGGWGVTMFFAISGYLIPASRMRQHWTTYVRNRAARILPALWTCLLITALVFAPVAARLSATDYEPGSAFGYVLNNALTQMAQLTIGDSLRGLPYLDWNGSIHTLSAELACYVVAGVLLSVPAFRRYQSFTAVCVLVVAMLMSFRTGPHLATFFAAGWIVASLRDRIRVTWPVVASAFVVMLATSWLLPVLLPVPLALFVLTLGGLVRTSALVTNDISYGTYLYAWPVQQLLALLGVPHLGPPVVGYLLYALLSLAGALALGAASWFLLERHCLPRRKPTGSSADISTTDPKPALAQAPQPSF